MLSDERTKEITRAGMAAINVLRCYLDELLADSEECRRDEEAVIVKINEMKKATMGEADAYENGWIDACGIILDSICNPQGG